MTVTAVCLSLMLFIAVGWSKENEECQRVEPDWAQSDTNLFAIYRTELRSDEVVQVIEPIGSFGLFTRDQGPLGHLTCLIIENGTNEIIYTNVIDDRTWMASLNVTDHIMFGNGSRVYILTCSDSNGVTKLRNVLITLTGSTKVETAANNGSTLLECSLTPVPAVEFQVNYTWNEKERGRVAIGPSLLVEEGGSYQCNVSIFYAACHPNKTISRNLLSEFADVKMEDARTTPHSTAAGAFTSPEVEATTTAPSASDSGATVDSVIAVMFLYVPVVIVIGTLVFEVKRRRSRHSAVSVEEHQLQQLSVRHPELLEMARSGDAMDRRALVDWADRTRAAVNFAGPVDPVTSELELWGRDVEAHFSRQNLIEYCGRYPRIPTLTHTWVTVPPRNAPTTINVLEDFYGRKILMSQAPTKTEIQGHWQALYQEKVGTIVWIGQLRNRNGQELILPYCPLRGKKTCRYGPFTITNSGIDLIEGENVMCRLAVNRGMGLVTLVHFQAWPASDLPSSTDHLARVIALISDQQSRAAERGLPAMLVHCSNGVGQSVGFTASYVGRQMLLSEGSVNPLALLKYIRRHRYLALSPQELTDKEIKCQAAVIGGVLKDLQDRSDLNNLL